VLLLGGLAIQLKWEENYSDKQGGQVLRQFAKALQTIRQGERGCDAGWLCAFGACRGGLWTYDGVVVGSEEVRLGSKRGRHGVCYWEGKCWESWRKCCRRYARVSGGCAACCLCALGA
jgi:hypothetical protein